REVARQSFERAFATEHFDMECRIRWPDASIHWISATGRAYRNAVGDPVRMMGTVMDITERKQADEALRISEAKYAGMVSISADAIISIDADQRVTIFNDGAEKIFGYARSEVIGAPLEILIPDRFRAAHRQHVERFAAGSETA